MSHYDQKKIESELKGFVNTHFVKPSACRNAAQISFYIQELCLKIGDLRKQFNYVPVWAYSLLEQYNSVQRRLLRVEFRSSYSR
jgi:hypothetical protein